MQKIRNQTWFYAFSLFALDETANLKVPAVGDKDFFVDHNCKENSILPKKMNLSIKVESSAKIPSKPPYSNTQRAVKTYFAVKVAISRTEWVLVRDLKQIRALERAVTEFLRSKDVDKNSLPSIKRKIKRFMCGISAKSVKTILKPEQVENFLNDVISSVPTSFGPLREFLELDNIFRFCISDDIEALKSFSMEKLRQTRDRCEGSAIHYAIGANATKVAGYLIQEVGIFLDLKDKFNISARTLFDRSEFLEIREITHASQQEKEPISDEKGLELPNFSVPLQYLKPSEKMRYTLIVNPISGKGQSLSILHNVVIPILRLRGIKFSVLGNRSCKSLYYAFQ